jgi:hypothetical protein
MKKYHLNQKNMNEERLSYSSAKDGMTKNIEVKKVENGYVITISEYGNKDDKYIDTRKEYISTSNPLLKKKEIDPIEAEEEMLSLLDGFGLS